MPEAAWCTECQRHVWVGPDGRCSEGHEPEALSGSYQASVSLPPVVASGPPRKFPRWLAPVVVVVALLVIAGVLGTPAWLVYTNVKAGNRLAKETDAFIAEQYPGYRVVQREPFTSYHASGAPGNNYFLQYSPEPRFVLLVAVLKPAKIDNKILQLKLVPNGDFLTTDDVFSRKAIDRTWVDEDTITRVIREYVRSKPSPSALVVRSYQQDSHIALGIAGKARYAKGLGYVSPLEVTHIAEARDVPDGSGDFSSRLEYTIRPYSGR